MRARDIAAAGAEGILAIALVWVAIVYLAVVAVYAAVALASWPLTICGRPFARVLARRRTMKLEHDDHDHAFGGKAGR